MTKCFFYLKDGSNSCVQSLGLRYLDVESAAIYAVSIARMLQANRATQAFVIVATDQKGNEIARAPIGHIGEQSTHGCSVYTAVERNVARIA